MAMLSTYPPTECGIATFSRSLAAAISDQGTTVNIVRLMNGDNSQSPQEVIHQHRDSRDTLLTRATLNSHQAVIVQHEFGIYGGLDGAEILEILDAVSVPIIVVVHTVLTRPTPHQRYIFSQLINKADALITMTNTGKVKLLAHYDVDPRIVHVIPHGAHQINNQSWMGTKARPRILTWGLLGPGKGIEWAIDAMKSLRDEYGITPMPEYLIAGETHPQVKRHTGESYRTSLLDRIHLHDLTEDVSLVNQYLDQAALARLIASADIVVLPYDSREQVTSGVLVEALTAGKPIISTNFPHAREVLSDGTGILVNQNDSRAIADGLKSLLRDPDGLARMQKRAEKKGNGYVWSNIGQQYVTLAGTLANSKSLAS